mmetsp:Transcript_76660/g.228504  ORF Transcript_76660/g.228504 Transcript_76660/m.228504 type:complete len:322 (+) Transcript_76660:121-1086(+)
MSLSPLVRLARSHRGSGCHVALAGQTGAMSRTAKTSAAQATSARTLPGSKQTVVASTPAAIWMLEPGGARRPTFTSVLTQPTRGRTVLATSLLPMARPASPLTAWCGRCIRGTTVRSTACSGTPTRARWTSAWTRRASRTSRPRTSSARAPAATSSASTTSPRGATTSTRRPLVALAASQAVPASSPSTPPGSRWRSAATRCTAPTSRAAKATGTTRPTVLPREKARSPCTWWPAATTTTKGVASTTGMRRPTTWTTARAPWRPCTLGARTGEATARAPDPGSWQTWRTASGLAMRGWHGRRPSATDSLWQWPRARPAALL